VTHLLYRNHCILMRARHRGARFRIFSSAALLSDSIEMLLMRFVCGCECEDRLQHNDAHRLQGGGTQRRGSSNHCEGANIRTAASEVAAACRVMRAHIQRGFHRRHFMSIHSTCAPGSDDAAGGCGCGCSEDDASADFSPAPVSTSSCGCSDSCFCCSSSPAGSSSCSSSCG
jgi:hypothetical protein